MGSHHHGLAQDLSRIELQRAARRRTLAWCAGLGAVGLIGCGSGGGSNSSATDGASTVTTGNDNATTPPTNTAPTTGTTPGSGSSGSGTSGGSTTTGNSGAESCPVVAEETNGPYPADGSNTSNGSVANALTLSGIVRSDIRSSIAGASGVAQGIPLTLKLHLSNSYASCASLEGFAVYLWHCDRAGNYSLYSASVINENYLRGVQASDANGDLSFTTIFPGCYAGRMPHLHFEIYRSLAVATDASHRIKTSQIAFPIDVCTTVYSEADGYSSSLRNFNQISFATDNVFSDGTSTEMSTVTGSLQQGYVATLNVGVPA